VGMNKRRILQKALAGSRNISFKEIVVLVEAFGFHLSRVNGSHHVFIHPRVQKVVNLQEENGKAKYYQVRQFLQLVQQNHLELGE